MESSCVSLNSSHFHRSFCLSSLFSYNKWRTLRCSRERPTSLLWLPLGLVRRDLWSTLKARLVCVVSSFFVENKTRNIELDKKTSTLPSWLYTVTCETCKYAVIYPWFSFLTIFILYVKQQMQHFCSKAIQKNSQRQNVPWSINGSTSSIHAKLLCCSSVTLTKTRRRGCAKDKDTKKQKTKTIHKMLLFKMDLPKCIQPFTGPVDSVGLLDFHHWML